MSNINCAVHGFLQVIDPEIRERNGISGSVDSHLQSCIAAESTLRQLFATDPENPIIKNPYVGLFDVFDLPVQARVAQPRDWTDTGAEFIWQHGHRTHRFPRQYILPIRPHLRRTPGAPCMVNDLSTFLAVWDLFSGGALSAIRDWDNIIVAGGSVLACLSSYPSDPSPKELFNIFQSPRYQNADIDLFLWGMSEEEAKRKMQEIFDNINSSLPWDVVCFRTKNTITIQAEYPKRPVQIIMRLYKSPAEILCGFDVDCCCVAFNGTNVFTNARGLIAMKRQCNTIDLSRRSPSYEHRLAKYSNRGYEIFYPTLNRNRINYARLANANRSAFPKGLGRLLVSEIMTANYRIFPRLYEDSDQYVRSAPVPVESLRPSNYDYAWCRIPYGPKWWDVQKVKEHVEKADSMIIRAIANERRESNPIHRHVMTCGTMIECLERCCEFYDPTVSTHEHHTRQDLANGLFRGPSTFIIDNPGRQLVGSFHPITHGEWELEAYLDDDAILDDDDDAILGDDDV